MPRSGPCWRCADQLVDPLPLFLLGLLAHAGTDVAVGELFGRFELVVVVPLAVGLAARARFARLSEVDDALAGLASLTVVLLLYCAMSGAPGGDELL
jgi:predicted Na+-dependent transporter